MVRAAARYQGFDPYGATLLQPGHNHTWRLPEAGAVGKVHGPPATFVSTYRQNLAALWLLDNGVPAARPIGPERYPVRHGTGRKVLHITFAEDLGNNTTPPEPEQLALLLRKLHGLPVPSRLGLPVFDPIPSLAMRISTLPVGILNRGRRERLRERLEAARAAWQTTEWPERMCVQHGDVGLANCITTPHGTPTLIDLERMAIGPGWWDLAAMAWRRDALGADPDEYAEFAAAYGVDITAHDHGRTYHQVLTPVWAISAWLAAVGYARQDPFWQRQADLRLVTVLADPLPPFPWHWALADRAGKKPLEVTP